MREMLDDSDRVTKEHSTHDSWWDGPRNYSYVNRNVVSICQTNTIREFLFAFFKGKIGFDIGGPGKINCAYGLDINFETARGINADGQCLPFKDNSIDFLISFHTLEHLPDIKRALAEWIRTLKPEGLVFAIMPDKKYFSHSNDPHIIKSLQAPSEMEPVEMESILDGFLDQIEILLFDSRKNNFDFDIVFRKKGEK